MSDSNSEEIWKPVPGYEGLYEVSTLGRVRSKDREVKTKAGWSKQVKGKVLSPCESGSGYYSVELYDGSEGERFYIHRLVARVFIGEPKDDLVVNHKDHDPRNNSVDNLEWVTQAENLRDARENTGANPSGVDAYRAKLTHRAVAEIKYLLSNTDLPQYEIAEEYEVQQSTISAINTGDRHSEVEQVKHDEDVRKLDIVFQDEDRLAHERPA